MAYHLLQLRGLDLQPVHSALHLRLEHVVGAHPRDVDERDPEERVDGLELAEQPVLEGVVEHLVLEIEGEVGAGLDEGAELPEAGGGRVAGDGVEELGPEVAAALGVHARYN